MNRMIASVADYVVIFFSLLLLGIASVGGVVFIVALALITTSWFWLAVIAIFLIARFT